MALSAIGAFGILAAAQSHAAVWENTQPWSTEIENQYSEWIQNDFRADTFAQKPGNALGMPVSQQQIPYLARALFSAKNGLPFLVRSRVDSRKFISNLSTAFDAEAEGDARLAAFLKNIRAGLTFDTLAMDSFPLAPSADAIRPGAFYLEYRSFTNPEADPTAMMIKTLDASTGVISFLLADHENEARTLTEGAPNITLQPSGSSGFMALRWAKADQSGLENHFQIEDPRFSALGQYQKNFTPNPAILRDSFLYRIMESVSGNKVDATVELKQEGLDLCLGARERLDWVDESLEFLEAQRQKDPTFSMKSGSSIYNKYSTPSRDKQFAIRYDAFRKKYRNLVNLALLEQELQSCEIRFGTSENEKLTLQEFRLRLLNSTASSDPNASREKRWGAPEPLIVATPVNP